MKLIFSEDFRKILKYQISCKSVQCKPNCFTRTFGRTDGQADLTNLRDDFRSFANAPENGIAFLSEWVC